MQLMTHVTSFLTVPLLVPPTALHVPRPSYTRWMEAMGPTLIKLLNKRP